jgi:hypothetical protein
MIVVMGLLSIPLITMQFTNEVQWTFSDFAVMGTLLLIVGLAINFAVQNITSLSRRLLIIAIVVISFLIIWAQLAVGLFGLPFAGS